MGARFNHATLAEGILEVGQEVLGKLRDAHDLGDLVAAEDFGKKAMGCWAQAQVHATLALAEQQRIANLIALEGQSTGEADPALYAEIGPEWGAARELRPEIKTALGIEAVA